MANDPEKPWLTRNPTKSMVVGAVVLAVVGIILTFTVVGSIIGLPLLGIAILLGLGAWLRTRQHSTSEL